MAQTWRAGRKRTGTQRPSAGERSGARPHSRGRAAGRADFGELVRARCGRDRGRARARGAALAAPAAPVPVAAMAGRAPGFRFCPGLAAACRARRRRVLGFAIGLTDLACRLRVHDVGREVRPSSADTDIRRNRIGAGSVAEARLEREPARIRRRWAHVAPHPARFLALICYFVGTWAALAWRTIWGAAGGAAAGRRQCASERLAAGAPGRRCETAQRDARSSVAVAARSVRHAVRRTRAACGRPVSAMSRTAPGPRKALAPASDRLRSTPASRCAAFRHRRPERRRQGSMRIAASRRRRAARQNVAHASAALCRRKQISAGKRAGCGATCATGGGCGRARAQAGGLRRGSGTNTMRRCRLSATMVALSSDIVDAVIGTQGREPMANRARRRRRARQARPGRGKIEIQELDRPLPPQDRRRWAASAGLERAHEPASRPHRRVPARRNQRVQPARPASAAPRRIARQQTVGCVPVRLRPARPGLRMQVRAMDVEEVHQSGRASWSLFVVLCRASVHAVAAACAWRAPAGFPLRIPTSEARAVSALLNLMIR